MEPLKAILRSLLYQVKRAKTLSEAIRAVEVMCTKDDIDAVYKSLRDLEEEEG